MRSPAFLLAVLMILAPPALAVCFTGPAPHVLRFRAEATADLDAGIFWDPAPEMFLRVYLDGLEVCNIDGGDGYQFVGVCNFDIPEPYDPVEIMLELMDSDEPVDDYTVDINPTAENTVTLIYDPKCGVIEEKSPGVIPACPAGNHLPECRGGRTIAGSEAYIDFSIAPADGVPLVDSSLSINNMEIIQVVPNSTRFIYDRQTVVRMDVGSSHDADRTAHITVTAQDPAGFVYTDILSVVVPECSTSTKVTFFGPEWEAPFGEAGFRPRSGPLNTFSVAAEIDPADDCVGAIPPCQPPFDCRIVDGQLTEDEKTLVTAKPLDVRYQPFERDPKLVCVNDTELEMPEVARLAARSLFEDLYPINEYRGASSTDRMRWPLPGVEPLIDLADNFDPRPGLILLELPYAIAGADRTVFVTSSGGLGCQWPSLDFTDAPGAAAGNLSRVSLAEPRRDFVPIPEVVVHEVSHTYSLAESSCPISGNIFAWFLCEDEYNYPPATTTMGNGGVASRGMQVLSWQMGENSAVRDMDGRGCVMGSSGAGTPNVWIDSMDYEQLLNDLTTTTPPGDSLFVRVRFTAGWGGEFLTEDVSRLTTTPTWQFDSVAGRDPDAYSATLRMLRADGTEIGTFSLTPETADLDADGIPESYSYAHRTEPLDFLDAAFILPLPPAAQRIELIRRFPGPTVLVRDVLVLSSPPIYVELLEPRTSFMALEGEAYDFRWRTLPGFRAAGGTPPPTRSYVFVSRDDGATWWPIAAHLPGDSYTWTPEFPGRVLVRVFSTSGFETMDVAGASDPDGDGCSGNGDPQPQTPDPDGADADGVAQVCDLCPTIYDPLQGDDDFDVVGNRCDNCPDDYNPLQIDTDSDGPGDSCDCSPQDGGVFAAPVEVENLTLAKSPLGPDYILFTAQDQAQQAGSSTVFDMVAGDASLFGTPNAFLDTTCVFIDATPAGGTAYHPAPQPGGVSWYLLRGQNGCGYGSYDSGGPGQQGSRDDLVSQGQQCT